MAFTTPEHAGSRPVSMAGSNSEKRLELRSIAAGAGPRYPHRLNPREFPPATHQPGLSTQIPRLNVEVRKEVP